MFPVYLALEGTWDLDYACYLRILVDERWKVCHSPSQDCWGPLPESLPKAVFLSGRQVDL